MKFQSDLFETAITGYGPGWVSVRGQRIEHSLLLHSSGERSQWQCARFEDLGSAHFEPLAANWSFSAAAHGCDFRKLPGFAP